MNIDDNHLGVLRDLLSQESTDVIHLPYTEAFERVHEAFQRETSLDIDRHAIWELIVQVHVENEQDRHVLRDERVVAEPASALAEGALAARPVTASETSEAEFPTLLFTEPPGEQGRTDSLVPVWQPPMSNESDEKRQLLLAAIARSEFGAADREVATILQQLPETRDNYITLCIRHWHRFHADVLEDWGVNDLGFLYKLRKWTTITRACWEIQNKLQLFRGLEETHQYRMLYQKDLQEYIEAHKNVVPEVRFYLDETGNEGDKAYVGIAGVCVINWRQYEIHEAALQQWREQQGSEPIHFSEMGWDRTPRAIALLDELQKRRGGLLFVGYALQARGSTREAIFTLFAQLVKDAMLYLRQHGSLGEPRVLRVIKEADPAFDNIYLERLTKHLTELVALECPNLLHVVPVEAVVKGRSVLLECADLIAGGMQRRALRKGSNPKDVLAEAVFNVTGFEDASEKGALFKMYPSS